MGDYFFPQNPVDRSDHEVLCLKIQQHKPNKHLYHHSEYGNARPAWSIFFQDQGMIGAEIVSGGLFFPGCGDVKWTTLRHMNLWVLNWSKISHILGSQNDKFVVVVDILKALSLLFVFFGRGERGGICCIRLHRLEWWRFGGCYDWLALQWFYTLSNPTSLFSVDRLGCPPSQYASGILSGLLSGSPSLKMWQNPGGDDCILCRGTHQMDRQSIPFLWRGQATLHELHGVKQGETSGRGKEACACDLLGEVILGVMRIKGQVHTVDGWNLAPPGMVLKPL